MIQFFYKIKDTQLNFKIHQCLLILRHVQIAKVKTTTEIAKINIQIPWDPILKELCEKKIKYKIKSTPITKENRIDFSWQKIKKNIEDGASEALSKPEPHKKQTINKIKKLTLNTEERGHQNHMLNIR